MKKIIEKPYIMRGLPRTNKVICICGKTFKQKLWRDSKGEVQCSRPACSTKCLRELNRGIKCKECNREITSNITCIRIVDKDKVVLFFCSKKCHVKYSKMIEEIERAKKTIEKMEESVNDAGEIYVVKKACLRVLKADLKELRKK
jgi:ribosomal protein L24E